MTDHRFGRQELLFGSEGQEKIQATSVAIVGGGGLGTRVSQDLVFLGTRRFSLIEPGELKESSRNRYIGQQQDDLVPGTPKLKIIERLIRSVDRDAIIDPIDEAFPSDRSIAALKNADVVFGCLDNEGSRFRLNQICAELNKPYIDLATEVFPGDGTEQVRYGGRVFVNWQRPGCLVCCDVLDMDEVAWDLASPEERQNRESIYGVRNLENGSGPSVVTLNGIVASIATTEFMVAVTGLRPPVRLTTYYGHLGQFRISKDEPRTGCLICGQTTS